MTVYAIDFDHGSIPHDIAVHETSFHVTGTPTTEPTWGDFFCSINPFCSSGAKPVKPKVTHHDTTVHHLTPTEGKLKRKRIGDEYMERAEKEPLQLGWLKVKRLPVEHQEGSGDENRLLSIHPAEPKHEIEREVLVPHADKAKWMDTYGQSVQAKKNFKALNKLIKEAKAQKEDTVSDMVKIHGSGHNGVSVPTLCKDIAKLQSDIQKQADICRQRHSSFRLQLTGVPLDKDIDLPRMWCTTVMKKMDDVNQMVKEACNGMYTMNVAPNGGSISVEEPPAPPDFTVKKGLDAVQQG